MAALVLVAVAAPVAAYSLADAPSARADRSEQSEHPGKALARGHDKGHDEAERPGKDEKPEKAEKSTGRPDDPSAAGRAHAQAMKEWTRCVADAASGPKPAGQVGPPKAQCDEKPLGPGRAKHGNAKKPTG